MGGETSNCRERLEKYCTGYGIDIGYGGDPIIPSAITMDLPVPYTKKGDAPLNLGGHASNLYWFTNECLDYVYSSHLLEDFFPDETFDILCEWLRVIKIGGNLVLYLPVEHKFKEHCKKTGQTYNPAHKVDNMSLDYIKRVLEPIPNVKIIHENPLSDIYSFEIVVKKIGPTPITKKGLLEYENEEFIKNVYRNILQREPDDGGFTFYLSQLKSGKLSKKEIIQIIQNSEEYKNIHRRDQKTERTTPSLNPIQRIRKPDMITPKKLMEELTIEDLCNTAESYYKNISDPTPQMAKPFSSFTDAPHLLCNLGLMISGLKLGKTMLVLDFGAGTCWLSRFLNQLGCSTICVDASITALNIGKKLFNNFPIIGEHIQPPRFLHYNGHRIEIEDESIDRIICFDTFHHIPNQSEILREFFRVLKPGGIVGFSEPGPHNSESPHAQYEMRDYQVLENDIVLSEIKNEADAIGFSHLSVKLASHLDLDMEYTDYMEIFSHKNLPNKVQNHIFNSLENATIFFLTKGKYIPDSRSHIGLKHVIEVPTTNYRAKLNEPIHIESTISNIGSAKWLHNNVRDIGVVKIGIHLYDSNRKLINRDYFRDNFEEDILPGQIFTKTISITHPERGTYYLEIDLVAESICWFGWFGSEPKSIKFTVE
jgi:ubiquinone/menaquinone biosynthesis C-methylase UbiE